MPATGKYPPELRERSVRLVGQALRSDARLSLTAAAEQVGGTLGVLPALVRGWLREAGVDAGQPLASDSGDCPVIEELEAEVRALQSVNDILRAAVLDLAREWDPPARLPVQANSSASAAAKASMSASVVSKAHIHRTSPVDGFQS